MASGAAVALGSPEIGERALQATSRQQDLQLSFAAYGSSAQSAQAAGQKPERLVDFSLTKDVHEAAPQAALRARPTRRERAISPSRSMKYRNSLSRSTARGTTTSAGRED